MDLLEREMAQDMLLMEKQLTQSYTLAEMECANEALRQRLHQLHEGTESVHARLFHAMHQRGWYQTPVAGQQAIETAILSWEQKEARGQEQENPR
jgi:spore coat protein CotF